MDHPQITEKNLPFAGEFFFSRAKKYSEVIFFVHFYEGSKKQLLRHIKFVNELGFDAFAFQLQGTHHDILSWRPPLSRKGVFGIKHVYADQIETLLNFIPGKKIVFAFSNPSAAAIEALARRFCSDISALICDSGPSARFLESAFSLATQEYNIRTYSPKMIFLPLMGLGWSPYLHQDLKRDLAQFPTGFKILSIRGWKDKLISPKHIDEVFEAHTQLQWTKLSLPEAEHLRGLRDFRTEYKPGVGRFLKSCATPCEVIHE